MPGKSEAINVRTTRINHLILGHSEATSCSRPVADALSREGLLDALCLLYDECNKDFLKKKDRNIFEFVNKYRDVIKEANNLRVNIDDFCIKSLIGKGYFGEVHLASEKATKDIYAIKKIRKSLTITSAQVKEERDIMACKSSEWITSLQYAFQDQEHLYLVMEYLPGGDLLSLMIRNGAFDEDLSRFYLAEMTQSLNALHQMGFVHRDIKPENILLDRFGHLKLADFGNAAAMNKDGNVVSMTPVGTPDYIAPELLDTLSTTLASKSVHDVTCDFWSMGVIGYEFITEVTPFHDDNVHETYSKILSHAESRIVPNLTYPEGVDVSNSFRNLIDGLVTKRSRRLNYENIVQHPFFKDVDWDNLRHQVPPIIPSLAGEDDTSNFEDIEKKGRRSTFTKSSKLTGFTKGNDFSGQNLPFIGYSFVHEESAEKSFDSSGASVVAKHTDHQQITRLTTKVNDMQRKVDNQVSDIQELQHQLLAAQRKSAQTESLEKILLEAKHELTNMKDKLKAKTVELAACKTDNKTLKSSLKIEEEMRLKSDANVSVVLNSTYQKWEKAKKLSEQNYEKQIAEKKTEIAALAQNLQAREHELGAKVEECTHLQDRVHKYKELLKTSKDQHLTEKKDFDASKKQLIETYEVKIKEFKAKLTQEKESKQSAIDELCSMRRDLNESICSTGSIEQLRQTADKNMDEIKSRMNRQIEENKKIREEKANSERNIIDLQKRLEETTKELLKIQNQAQLYEQQLAHQTSRRSSGGGSELFRSAQGSLESISSGVEDQLRTDLVTAKQNESLQRKRADRLEEAVSRLEDAIHKLQPQPQDNLLERKNEKLEDQLASVREQAIVERQASRTAHLSLYKLEKQIEDCNLEKKVNSRRLELAEEKFGKLRIEKEELERQLRDNQSVIKSKEDRFNELQQQIKDLKIDLKKEHAMWEKSEHERMKDKSEIIEHVSKIHHLEEHISEQRRKMSILESRYDSVTLENKRITKERANEQDDLYDAEEHVNQLVSELDNIKRNYEMLKGACTLMETQLNELEAMLESEVTQNQVHCQKNDQLWTTLRAKDDSISALRQQLDEQTSVKIAAESRCIQLATEIKELNDIKSGQHLQLIDQQEELLRKTSSLFEVQETNEVLTADLANLERIKDNYSRELHILKEENSQVLTELFLAKEEMNRISMERKECRVEIEKQRKELEQMKGTMSEQKNYYLHRDIKFEATQEQLKKLISYLQQRVDELSHKKKKSFADVIFGTNSSRKENTPPNNSAVEESLTFKRVQDELKRERIRSSQLKEQLLQAKTDMRSSAEIKSIPSAPPAEELVQHKFSNAAVQKSERNPDIRSRSEQTHRFEMTLESSSADLPFTACLACRKQIMVSHPYMKCKECKGSIHRKCRGDVRATCEGEELMQMQAQTESEESSDETVSIGTGVDVFGGGSSSTDGCSGVDVGVPQRDYFGDLVFRSADLSPPLKVQCVYEIQEGLLLLGAETGLYSFNQNTQLLVHITQVTGIISIAVCPALSKCILIGDQGQQLYMCDLRHLQSRAQSSACLKPKLETTPLELAFANRLPTERWLYVSISGPQKGQSKHCDGYAIACTSSRLVILRFDIAQNRVKLVCALDTAKPVTCVLFTAHSAIVSSDKFFEIDLQSLQAEEFMDESDMSCIEARTICHPRAVFKINSQEFLLCFTEFGVFVDNYGDRSRPDNLSWANPPTGFLFRDPLLFVTYRNMVEVVRINKSYSNELQQRKRRSASNANGAEVTSEVRSYITMNEPRLVGDSGTHSAYVLASSMGKNGGILGDELISVNGIRSLKTTASNSTETLLSSAAGAAGSSETISTINNLSDE